MMMYENGKNQKKGGLTKGQAIALGMVAVCLFVLGAILAGAGLMDYENTGTQKAENWFDPYSGKEEKQLLYFCMITDSFANYELNENRQLHFVMDDYGETYIVCMNRKDFETFRDVYEYTYYGDDEETAPSGRIEGYPSPIDEELKGLAIESLNEMLSTQYLTEDNFYDYVGSYYLDATYVPKGSDAPMELIGIGLLSMAVGLILLIAVVRARRKIVLADEKWHQTPIAERAAMVQRHDEQGALGGYGGGYDLNGESSAGTGRTVSGAAGSGAGPESIQAVAEGNPLLGLLGAAVGAGAGGILWIVFYKMGFIAGISGYAAVFGADWGYKKLGGKEPKGISFALCVALGMAMIVFANYISYAWEIVDTVNSVNAGGASFGTVFWHLPYLMREYELMGSFVAELAMGFLFSVFAVISEVANRRRGMRR